MDRNNYNTKQRDEIVEFFSRHRGSCFTAKDIITSGEVTGVKQSEAPGLYKYYSTQRPVDIGTFPKPPRNAPDEIVNYDQRVPVENGSFLAWGHLTYTRPLTKRQASDYELRPAPNNPDRLRSIQEQMKTAAKQVEADRGQSAPKKNAPDRGNR